MHNLHIGTLIAPSYIVGLTGNTLMIDEINRLAMIEHVEPITHILPLAIDGNGLACEALANDGGDELLVMLLGSIVVRTVGCRDIHPIGMMVGAHEEVRARLARRIRAIGRIRSRLSKEPFRSQSTIDLIGRDMVEAARLIARLVLLGCLHPVAARAFEEVEGADNVGLDKGARS